MEKDFFSMDIMHGHHYGHRGHYVGDNNQASRLQNLTRIYYEFASLLTL